MKTEFKVIKVADVGKKLLNNEYCHLTKEKCSGLKIWKVNKKLANLQCEITEKTTRKF